MCGSLLLWSLLCGVIRPLVTLVKIKAHVCVHVCVFPRVGCVLGHKYMRTEEMVAAGSRLGGVITEPGSKGELGERVPAVFDVNVGSCRERCSHFPLYLPLVRPPPAVNAFQSAAFCLPLFVFSPSSPSGGVKRPGSSRCRPVIPTGWTFGTSDSDSVL